MEDVLKRTQLDGSVFIAPPSQSPARLLGLSLHRLKSRFFSALSALVGQQKGLGNPCQGLCRPKPTETAGHL